MNFNIYLLAIFPTMSSWRFDESESLMRYAMLIFVKFYVCLMSILGILIKIFEIPSISSSVGFSEEFFYSIKKNNYNRIRNNSHKNLNISICIPQFPPDRIDYKFSTNRMIYQILRKNFAATGPIAIFNGI